MYIRRLRQSAESLPFQPHLNCIERLGTQQHEVDEHPES